MDLTGCYNRHNASRELQIKQENRISIQRGVEKADAKQFRRKIQREVPTAPALVKETKMESACCVIDKEGGLPQDVSPEQVYVLEVLCGLPHVHCTPLDVNIPGRIKSKFVVLLFQDRAFVMFILLFTTTCFMSTCLSTQVTMSSRLQAFSDSSTSEVSFHTVG